MRKIRSQGVILLEDKVLIARHYNYKNNEEFWLLPGGSLKENETSEEALIREIKEETNLDIELDTNFKKTITYFINSKQVFKDSVYFVATPITFDLKSQEGEIEECIWCSYDEVLDKLEFENSKEVFKEAYKYIKD